MARSLFLFLALSSLISYYLCEGDLGSLDTAINPDLSSKSMHGYTALLLGEHFDLNITITFTSNLTSNCLVLVNIDENFLILHGDSDNNVSITHGDGVVPDQEIIQTNGSYLKIDFGDVATISSADGNNITLVTVPMGLIKPSSFADLLNISSSVSFELFSVQYELDSRETVYFLGPEVDSNANWNNNDNVVVDSYIEVAFTMQILANSELQDLEVTQDFSSSDLASLPMTYIQCLASPTIGNISFSSVSNTNITKFNSTMVSSFDQVIRPKRQASGSSLSSNILLWDVGDVSNDGDTVAVLDVQMIFSFGAILDADPTDSIKHSLSLNLNGGSAQIISTNLGISIPQLTITKSVKNAGYIDVNGDKIEVLHFTTVVTHDASYSNSEAFEVSVDDYVKGFVVEYFDGFEPLIGTAGLSVSHSWLSYTKGSLNVSDNITLSYKAYFNADTLSKDEEELHFPATVKWQSLSKALSKPSFPGTQYGPVQDSICVQMNVKYDSSNPVTKHGLAALAFFVCVLIGMVIVVVVAIVCIQFFHKGPYSMVQPVAGGQARGLLIDSNLAGKTITSSYEESSLVSVNDSIVLILILEQNSQKYTEFDNLDILITITLDIELEEQRVEAMTKSVELLVQQWTQKKLVAKDMASKLGKKFQRSWKDLTKKMSDEFRRDSLMLRKQLIAMNSIKLTQQQQKQKKEYRKAVEDTKFMPDGDGQSEILQLLQQQHEAETANLSSMLKLQQDEQQEILRKEFAIRKRIGIKSIQQEYLDQVILQGKLDEEQARELISNHWQNMAILEKRMDEDISKQRMLLEEKLERHRALAARNVSQEEHHKEILNMMAKQTMGALQQLQEDDQLSEGQVHQYVEKLQKEVVVAKDKYEQDKKKQEENLHKRMSALKKQKLSDKVKEHKSQLEEFENEQKEKQVDGKLESSEYLDSRLQLLSKQRLELNDIENELDEEAANELEELREKLTENMERTIQKTKNSLYSDLKSKGLTDEMKDEILEEHQRDVERLNERREELKTKQEEDLKKRLAEKRKDWAKRKEDEKDEQMQIREHERKMVGKLLSTQLVMSEIDRDKVMQEHEQQMVTLENNLTLNKLHQRRKLEEKMAVRRARQMEKLERQQQQEEKRQLRSKQLGSDDEDDSEEIQMMMKKHAEQRLALLSTEKSQMDHDLDSIRVEMLHERANALKKQEEKLGSMMAQLQMEKAREMATIEEQQKVLMQLKMSILDDMTERGVIQNSQSKKVIENHRKEIQQLESKLNDVREKQEKEFRKKLKEKQMEREKTFLQEQDLELSRLLDSEANSTKAKLKRVALKHKQTIELEDFRQTLQMEIRQSLEDLRRSFQIRQLKAIQDQDLRLIGNLIRHGKYGNMELVNILKLLFPMKMEKELKQLISEMHNNNDTEDVQPDTDDQDESDGHEPKQGEKKRKQKSKKQKASGKRLTLERKVRSAILKRSSHTSEDSTSKKTAKKLVPIVNKRYDDEEPLHKSPLPSIHGVRPDPIGRADSMDYATEQSIEDMQDEEEISRKQMKKKRLKGFKKGKF